MRTSLLVLLLTLGILGCSHSNRKVASDERAPYQPPQTPRPALAACTKKSHFTLAVHGGVGYTANAAQSEVIRKILAEGHQQLKDGVDAMFVVQHAAEIFEDSGIFNAGRGGTRTNKNTVELDASIMDGSDLSAGAVASLVDVKNPIRLAYVVKAKTKHVFMVGPGASALAREFELETVTPDYFTASPYIHSRNETQPPKTHGTVGAVALDRCGNLAAATSTGGLYGKRPGRVGDSPVIGAGTYANNETAAVSATGEGEKFIRANVGVRISNIIQYTKRSLKSAVIESLNLVEKLGGGGGLIAVDKKGQPLLATSKAAPMPSGYVQESGKVIVRDLVP
ncbi:MAG: isoaspartyl peptidase/L-asparaginase [Bdellovibrionota bacterium]